MAFLWGASWPAGRFIVQEMPPLTASALRFLLASAVLLPWMYMAGGFAQLKHWHWTRWLGMAAAGATGVFGYAACFLSGLQYLPAGKAALIVTLNPVLTLFVAAWIFRERLNATIAWGMMLAVIGAITVISHGDLPFLLRGGIGRGEILILGCVLCWVCYTLIGRWVMQGIDALSATVITSVWGAVLLLIFSWCVEGSTAYRESWNASAPTWSALLFLAWGATALAYAWYFSGVKALGAGAASGYITLVPVIGVVVSALWLGEVVDLYTVLGGVFAVCGTAIMHWGRLRLA